MFSISLHRPHVLDRIHFGRLLEVFPARTGFTHQALAPEGEVVDVAGLEAMAHWRIYVRPECRRHDKKRNLLDDNPSSG